jgi:hypothetical protein
MEALDNDDPDSLKVFVDSYFTSAGSTSSNDAIYMKRQARKAGVYKIAKCATLGNALELMNDPILAHTKIIGKPGENQAVMVKQQTYLADLMGEIGTTPATLISLDCKLVFKADGNVGTALLDAMITEYKRRAEMTEETNANIFATVVALAIMTCEIKGAPGKLAYATMPQEDVIPSRIQAVLAWASSASRCPGAAEYCPSLHALQRTAARTSSSRMRA